MPTDSAKSNKETVDTKVDLTIVVKINGQDYTLHLGDIQKFKDEGVKFSLPEQIPIGNFKALETFLNQELGDANINLPKSSDFPAPFDDLFEKAEEVDFTITKFDFDYPKSGQYGFDLSITASTSLDLKLLQVSKISFDISRASVPGADTSSDKQGSTSKGK